MRQYSGKERVHPYVEAPPLQYPTVESYDNQHGLDMPNDAVQKEQKEGLIEQNRNEGLNQEAQMGAMVRPQRQRSRRRRCCVRCCCCVGICVGTVVAILGILVLLFFLVLHPKLPKYTITEASISEFSMSNATSRSNSSAAIASAVLGGEEGVYLSVEMQVGVKMRNPNKKIGIDYREISGKLLYAGVEIGEGSIPAFYQGHKNTTYVELARQGRDIELTQSLADTLGNTLKNEESIVLHARSITLVRIKIGRWRSHTSKVRVKCSIQLSNPTRGPVRLLHNSCKFKLLRLHL